MKIIYNSHEIGDNYNNYNRVTDKPLINSTELVGNITLNDINVYSKEEVKRLISSTRSVKVALVLPSPVSPNTTYYIGPDMNGIYTVYLTDSSDPINCFSIGTTSFGKYYPGDAVAIDSENNVSVLVDSESVYYTSEGLLAARPVFEKMEPFKGATASADGSGGIVPAPAQYYNTCWLTNKSTWERSAILNAVYPVGSIYITQTNTNPGTILMNGTASHSSTWTLLDAGYGLRTSTDGGGTKLTSKLPNIKGTYNLFAVNDYLCDGHSSSSKYLIKMSYPGDSQTVSGGGKDGGSYTDRGNLSTVRTNFKASSYNSIYSDSTTIVQPYARTVFVWRRTA